MSAVDEKHRGLGIAQTLDNEKVRVARTMGYSAMIATVKNDNKAQHRAMQKANPLWISLCPITEDTTLHLRKLI